MKSINRIILVYMFRAYDQKIGIRELEYDVFKNANKKRPYPGDDRWDEIVF